MALTEAAVRRIHFLIYGSWGDDDPFWDEAGDAEFEGRYERLYPEVLGAIDSAEELHQYAMNYNWDDGKKKLRQIIDHPLCDEGTALALFWIGQPAYKFSLDHEPGEGDWMREGYRFMKDLESKLLNHGFPGRSIAVDPRNLDGHDYTKPNSDEVKGMERIPEALKQTTPGSPLAWVRY